MVNKGKRIFLIAVTVITLVLVLTFVRKGDENGAIRIGAILPLTGKYADTGKSVLAGLEIAREQLAKNARQEYEIVYFDTKSETKNATLGYNNLKAMKGAQIFFTTLSDNSLAIKNQAIKDGNVLFCLASHEDITKDSSHCVFRPINTGVDEAEFLTEYIRNSVKPRKVFFYIFNTEAGKAVEEVFRDNFSTNLVGVCLYGEDPVALRNVTTAATYDEADCIVVIGYSPTMGLIVKHLREAGYKGEIVANLGFNNPTTIKVAGGYAKSIWYNDYDFPYNTAEYQSRKAIASEKYKCDFTALSYTAFSCLQILNNVITAVGTLPKDIGQYLSRSGQYEVEGITFVSYPDGSIKAKYKMMQIEE